MPPPPPFGGGLSGQVIINQSGTTGIFNETTGRVRIGQVGTSGWLNIASPAYPLKSSQIGGGAVGLAPFALHREDCVPVYGDNPAAAMLTSGFLATRPPGVPEAMVTIRSYGPMEIADGYADDEAVRVEIQNPDNCESWFEADEFFTVTLFPGGNRREVRLARVDGSVPYAGLYRVVPEGLVCSDVDGLPAVAWPTSYPGSAGEGAYVFRVGADCAGPAAGSAPNGVLDYFDIVGNAGVNPPIPPCSGCDGNSNWTLDTCEILPSDVCRCDWTGDNVVSVQDLFTFLTCYFGGDGDFNLSGQTTAQDIFDFLACFFGRPHPCRAL